MSKLLTAQENIRMSPDIKIRFEEAVNRGCYSKSQVLRSLIEEWVEAQEQAK